MPGLTKKKVTVRTKRGKVYQRSMNVRSTSRMTIASIPKLRGSLSAKQYIRAHGATMGKAMLGIGVLQGAAGHAYMRHGKTGDGLQRAAMGSLGAGAVGAAAAFTNRKVRQGQNDFHKLGLGARLAVQSFHLGANLAGHAVGWGASHYAHKLARR